MEILNNLWIAISTPNVGLINLIAIPATVIEFIFMLLLIISVLNITVTLKQKYTFVISLTLVSLLTMSFLPKGFNIPLNYILMVILAYKLFDVSLLKSLFSVVLSALIFNIVGALTLNPYITLLNIIKHL